MANFFFFWLMFVAYKPLLSILIHSITTDLFTMKSIQLFVSKWHRENYRTKQKRKSGGDQWKRERLLHFTSLLTPGQAARLFSLLNIFKCSAFRNVTLTMTDAGETCWQLHNKMDLRGDFLYASPAEQYITNLVFLCYHKDAKTKTIL